jgi:uncharacterized protein (TIGR02391 family)
MNTKANPKLAAIRIGDFLKYDTSMNEIDRIASAVFPFAREEFPSEGITSVRAQRIYEWLMTRFKHKLSDAEKLHLLESFLISLTPPKMRNAINQILQECGIPLKMGELVDMSEFDARKFHPEVIAHSRDLFLKGHYFHAVFEAAKAYNAAVRMKCGLTGLDGQALMNKVFSSQKPIIWITSCTTETEKKLQDGYRFIAAGLMAAVRNPTAHEPATSFPIGTEDALDMLSLMSYLFRWLDKAKTGSGES